MKEPRITARIRRSDGSEKTVSFRGTTENMEKRMKTFFHATEYIIYKIGDLQFYHKRDFTKIKGAENERDNG